MKFLFQLFFLTFISVELNAQITIDETDIAVVGDFIPRKSDTMTVLTSPGPSGPNQLWDLSQTSFYVVQENTNVVDPSSTPNGSSFSNATSAMTNDNSSYLYFNNSTNSYNCLGFSGDLLNTGTPIVAPFLPDLTLHQFPRTYNSSFNDAYVMDITIPGSSINPLLNQVRFKRTSNVIDVTDGWGIIKTPGDRSYEALRVHTTTTSIDSVWTLPIFPPTWTLANTSQSTSETYTWLAKGGKLAVAEMSFDTTGAPKIFKWTELPGIALSVTELNSIFEVSPNPSSDFITISIDEKSLNQNYFVSNILGEVQLIGKIDSTKFEINLAELKNGVYILAIENSAKKVKILKE